MDSVGSMATTANAKVKLSSGPQQHVGAQGLHAWPEHRRLLLPLQLAKTTVYLTYGNLSAECTHADGQSGCCSMIFPDVLLLIEGTKWS